MHTLPNWENSSPVLLIIFYALTIAYFGEFLRKAGENACDWIDEKGDELSEIAEDFGFIEQDFNR